MRRARPALAGTANGAPSARPEPCNLRSSRRYDRPAMPARKPGRYLAPLALVAVIVATVLVVRAGLGTTHHPTATSAARAARVRAAGQIRPRKSFYVIRSGDSLSIISVKTGVAMSRLEALNPAIDPQALQTGQRLRLRP